MSDRNTEDRILAEYDTSIQGYVLLTSKLEQLIQEILRARGIQVHSISGRYKTRTSLSGKLKKNDNKYESLTDLTDLAGLRIITHLAEDVDLVAKAIEDEFTIDPSNSVDKRRSLASDRFGYMSMHQVILLGDDRCNLTEYKAFKDLKAEIQTRSILQHAWAEIEHDLGYKSEIEVPQHIRRRFALVAGLLELADKEFDGIKAELEKYRAEIPAIVQETPEDASLNLDSMTVLLEGESIVTDFDQKIAAISSLEYVGFYEQATTTYLPRMQRMGIKTVSDLSISLVSQEKLILLFAKYWDESANTQTSVNEYIGAGVSLYYLWLIWLSTQGNEASIRGMLIKGSHSRPSETVQRLLSVAEKAREELAKS
jgi:putative GTP pyrophosphokinase